MIPLRDENPTRTIPFITYFLVTTNILVFLYNGTMGQNTQNPLAGFELVPAQLFGQNGAIYTPVPPWLTIFTSMFLHANWLHVGGNMLYLWIFGNNVEDALGHFKFVFFYLVCGIGAAMAQVISDPFSRIPMVGASGAVAGILAAYLILFPRAGIVCLVFFFYFVRLIVLPASLVLGYWILIQLFNSMFLGMPKGGGIAYAAHIGGFFTGLLLIFLFRKRRPTYGSRVRIRSSWDDLLD